MKRRDFLRTLSEAGMSPYFLRMLPLLQLSLLNTATNKAYAQATGTKVKNFFKVQQGGAPSRWMYDLFLNPYSDDTPSQLSPFIGNAFKANGGRYTALDYRTVKYKGVNVSPIWNTKVEVSAGSTPISQLLDHMICVQGINVVPGHVIAVERDYQPLGAPVSLTSLSGDHGDKSIFKCITTHTGSSRYYKSGKGHNATYISGTLGLIQKLVDPILINVPASQETNLAATERAVASVMNDFHNLAKQTYSKNLTLSNNYSDAADLISQGFGDVAGIWSEKVARYKTIISKAISATTIQGINDLPIGTTGTRGVEYKFVSNIITTSDLRTLVNADTTIHYLGERFAFAEFLFENNLTNCFEAGVSNMIRLVTGSGNSVSIMNSDQHGAGPMVTTYLTSLYHLANAACLLEFINKMKQKNLFNDMLIEVSGEFNRNPRADLKGSDHGGSAKSTTYFSGDIEGPFVTGLLTSQDDPKYPGFWGQGASIRSLSSPLQGRDQAAITTYLLGLDPLLLGSAKSILYKVGGKITSTIGESRVV